MSSMSETETDTMGRHGWKLQLHSQRDTCLGLGRQSVCYVDKMGKNNYLCRLQIACFGDFRQMQKSRQLRLLSWLRRKS